jgi:hypothetical protein
MEDFTAVAVTVAVSAAEVAAVVCFLVAIATLATVSGPIVLLAAMMVFIVADRGEEGDFSRDS